MSMATDDVLAERQLQIDAYGLTEGNDDQHDDKSLALVGACYERHVQTLDPLQTVRALISCCRR